MLMEHGNNFQMGCLWFWFARIIIIKKESDNVRDHWNNHCIRKSHQDTVPGVSDILYYPTESISAVNCLVPVSNLKIQEVELQY